MRPSAQVRHPRPLRDAMMADSFPLPADRCCPPHLQVRADRTPANYQRVAQSRAAEHWGDFGTRVFSDYLAAGMTVVGRFPLKQWRATRSHR